MYRNCPEEKGRISTGIYRQRGSHGSFGSLLRGMMKVRKTMRTRKKETLPEVWRGNSWEGRDEE
jgi:hypothetical protein